MSLALADVALDSCHVSLVASAYSLVGLANQLASLQTELTIRDQALSARHFPCMMTETGGLVGAESSGTIDRSFVSWK
jgi:hypothetical protein